MSSAATPPSPRDPGRGTAGITASAPAGARSPQGPPGLGGGAPGFRSPLRPPGQQGDTGAPGTPTGPRWRQLPPREAGLPTPSGTSIPELHLRPSPGPNLPSAAGRRREGCGPGTPALGEGAGTPVPHPRPSAEGSREAACCPRTCLAGQLSAVAAQVSEPLPPSPRVSPDQSRPRPPSSDC